MFTGLVEITGTVVSVAPTAGATRLTIHAPAIAAHLHLGDSVAVSGVCLTAVAIHADSFSADLAAETISRTTLGTLIPGRTVNLERPTPAGTPLGGHIVQGHVDGVGTLAALTPLTRDLAATDWRLRVSIPRDLLRYIAPQGSIAVEGISLTVAAVHADAVEIAIIPHTHAATNLHTLAAGSPVNIEVDMLAKYAEKLLAARNNATPLTAADLIARGF
jgi:riboflavin synthase